MKEDECIEKCNAVSGQNFSISSSWVYFRGSSDNSPNFHNPNVPETDDDYIKDEKMLQQYLYDFENYEKVNNASCNATDQSPNLLSNFWKDTTNNPGNVSIFSKITQYVMAQPSSGKDHVVFELYLMEMD